MENESKPDADKGAPKKAEKRDQSSAPLRLRPREWAERLGQVQKADPRKPQDPSGYRPAHAAADRLYGWDDHAYNFEQGKKPDDQGHWPQDVFTLTQDDYRKSLECALAFPAAAPHPAGLPDSQRQRFAKFKPKARNPHKRPRAEGQA